MKKDLATFKEQLDEDERACMRAQSLCDDGFFAKGCKALGRNRVLDGNSPEVQKVVESKHPPPLPDPEHPGEFLQFTIEEGLLLKSLKIVSCCYFGDWSNIS